MNTVYINRKSARNFAALRDYLTEYFRMSSKATSLVKANIDSGLSYFVVGGVTFEDRSAFE